MQKTGQEIGMAIALVSRRLFEGKSISSNTEYGDFSVSLKRISKHRSHEIDKDPSK